MTYAEMGRSFRLELRDTGWRVEFLDGTERAASDEETALWLTGLAFREMEDDISRLRDEVKSLRGNAGRETKLKREANARVRILRDALRWAIDEAHAYGLDVTCYCEDSHQGVALGECPHGLCATVRTALERTGKRGMPK